MNEQAELDALTRETGIEDLPERLRGIAAAPPSANWRALLDKSVADRVAATIERLRPGPARAPAESASRLATVRAKLAELGLDAFLVPRADEFQGESVPARAERLAWLTGFTGSAGLAVVLAEQAVLFVDGRYTVQAPAETDRGLWTIRHLIDEPPAGWLAKTLPRGARVGYDPWLHTAAGRETLEKKLQPAGIQLVPVAANLIDVAWANQPPPPLGAVVPHDLAYAGKPAAEKRAELGQALAAQGIDAAVISAPESIAWLLNIRGGDVPNTPLPLGFALLSADGSVSVHIDRRKLTPNLGVHLGNQVSVQPPDAFGAALDALGAAGRQVLVDPNHAPVWVVDRLAKAGAKIKRDADPCTLPRARKNAVELAGAKSSHVRDGAAVVRFLAWLDREAPAGRLDEVETAAKLRSFRAADPLFRDVSFETISAAGPNAALPHYRSTPATNRRLEPGTLYLVDSGAQYLDGTTDITRTIAVGTPTAEHRTRFTLVLQGHMALSRLVFPKGTTGAQIDAFARQALWRHGLDYDHGTGHGVGSYLGVHEGPARISKIPNTVALEPGMILSNEPGYYKVGAYGIRTENLEVVTPIEIAGAERPMLGFSTLTLAPIDLTLVDTALLSPEDRAWLDAYHARVRTELSSLVDGDALAWLMRATRPLD